MTTDREKLEKMQAELMSSEEKSYDRMKKENVLDKLIASCFKRTGELSKQIIIPLYEHDGDFLKKTLKNLGYDATYEERYNDRFKKNCCIVRLSAKREQE